MPSNISYGSVARFAYGVADGVAKGVKDVRAEEKRANPSSTSRADKYVSSWDNGKQAGKGYATFQALQSRSSKR